MNVNQLRNPRPSSRSMNVSNRSRRVAQRQHPASALILFVRPVDPLRNPAWRNKSANAKTRSRGASADGIEFADVASQRQQFIVERSASNFLREASGVMSLYSLLQIEKVNCVDGYQYLRRLVTKLAKIGTAADYDALRPWSIGIAES